MKTFLCYVVTAYLIAGLLPIANGYNTASQLWAARRELCATKWSRGEYVFPFYRLGCWLGEVP